MRKSSGFFVVVFVVLFCFVVVVVLFFIVEKASRRGLNLYRKSMEPELVVYTLKNIPTNLVARPYLMPSFSSLPQSTAKGIDVHTYIHTYSQSLLYDFSSIEITTFFVIFV